MASERGAWRSLPRSKPQRSRRAATWNRRDKPAQRIALQPAGTLFSPTGSLVWMIGILGVAACIAPWIARGWLMVRADSSTTVALLAFYDAFALWRARGECAPVLLPPEKGFRGRQGQSIQVPLALTGSGRHRMRSEVRVAIMPATPESETAIRVKSDPQRLKLEQPKAAAEGLSFSNHREYSGLAMDARDCFASARSVAGAARWHRAVLAPRNLAVAAMVRFAGAIANRGGFAVRATGDSAQPGLPHARRFAPNSVDRTRT